jgi:hypothetical protein
MLLNSKAATIRAPAATTTNENQQQQLLAQPADMAGTHPAPDIATQHQQIDLELRKYLKNMNTALEKIQALVKVEEVQNTGSLTNSAKTFTSKHLKPAISCLRNRFGGDCVAFATKYSFNHTTFLLWWRGRNLLTKNQIVKTNHHHPNW